MKDNVCLMYLCASVCLAHFLLRAVLMCQCVSTIIHGHVYEVIRFLVYLCVDVFVC